MSSFVSSRLSPRGANSGCGPIAYVRVVGRGSKGEIGTKGKRRKEEEAEWRWSASKPFGANEEGRRPISEAWQRQQRIAFGKQEVSTVLLAPKSFHEHSEWLHVGLVSVVVAVAVVSNAAFNAASNAAAAALELQL